MAEPRGFGFPFRAEPDGFPKMETGIALDEANLKQILLTEPGERRMRPGFGAKLRRFLFEPFDDATKLAIQAEVFRAIRDSTEGKTRYAILGIDVTFETASKVGGASRTTKKIVINVLFDSFGRRSQVNFSVGA